MAATQGKSMRELVIEFIKSSLQKTRPINFDESSKE
jgi:hypothetical protein